VLDAEKADTFRNTSWWEIRIAETIDGHLAKRSFLQRIDQRLLRKGPIQREDNPIEQNDRC
jgi:hypothetical protein